MPSATPSFAVLVVEDHPLQRKLAEALLQGLGVVDVVAVTNGLEAARALQDRPFDLVVCDIDMPYCNGPELIALLASRGNRAFAARPPVWAWTSIVAPEILESHRALAAQHVFPRVHALQKPLDASALRRIVDDTRALFRHHATPHREQPSQDELVGLASDASALMIWMQPQYQLDSGVLSGAEALCRWQHPRLGVLTPDRFIDALESLDAADVVFDAAAARALAVLRQLLAAGIKLKIGINASARTLCKPGLIERLEAAVSIAAIPRAAITIELTEQVPADDPLRLSVALNRLRLLGYGIAIDDFGVGIATLKLLADSPFTQLKIDRAFVADVLLDTQRGKICRSMIQLARDLGMECVAEGIEVESQRAALRDLGCHIGQGYLWAPALTEEAFLALAGSGAAGAPGTCAATP